MHYSFAMLTRSDVRRKEDSKTEVDMSLVPESRRMTSENTVELRIGI